MLIGFVLHHTGTIEKPPVWGEEVEARIFRRELLRKGIDAVIINQNEHFPTQPDLVLYLSSDVPLKGGKVKFLRVANDWDFKKMGKNLQVFDQAYDLVLLASSVLYRLYKHGPLFQMPGDPELYYPRGADGAFQKVDVVYVSNNIKPDLNDGWIKPLASHLGTDRFRIYGSVWGGSGLEPWWGGAPPGMVVPDIFANAKIVLSLHMQPHREYNAPTCRIPEALLSGRPIVSDMVGYDLYNPYVWYCSSDKEIIPAVEEILSDYPAAVARAMRGREFVLANHTFIHRTEELLKYYEMITKR